MIVNKYIPTEYLNKVNSVASNNNKESNTNTSSVSFSDVLGEKIQAVNDKIVESENKTINFINGEEEDIHNVMISAEEAKESLQLAVEVRNKLVDAYKEILSMQL
ncbi:flagellar hook-basal body complex protein FliE [Clostridium bornimense]|uniref:flagellar hook-basal body complex protein FliE n=1 Tax=Clostridium bornimense TaxID=1216932 RepID=UPI001C1137C6|nr:flagellar hook-basal body complex protein FliE [Clostridium bornimense]MBU5314773.1 flagellar hook-basal body complex protein FliE [Clostridium bornimense]